MMKTTRSDKMVKKQIIDIDVYDIFHKELTTATVQQVQGKVNIIQKQKLGMWVDVMGMEISGWGEDEVWSTLLC